MLLEIADCMLVSLEMPENSGINRRISPNTLGAITPSPRLISRTMIAVDHQEAEHGQSRRPYSRSSTSIFDGMHCMLKAKENPLLQGVVSAVQLNRHSSVLAACMIQGASGNSGKGYFRMPLSHSGSSSAPPEVRLLS